MMIFYDELAGRFFYSNYETLKKVADDLNERLSINDGDITVSDMLDALGFPPPVEDKLVINHYGIRGQKFGSRINQNGEEKMNKTEIHKAICQELTDLYERKNADYGDSFAELRKEFPNSVCLRLTDKLNRLKKLTNTKEPAKVEESIEDTLKDIANYAILELIERGYKPSIAKRNLLKCEFNTHIGAISLNYYDEYEKLYETSFYISDLFNDKSRRLFRAGNCIYDFLTKINNECWNDTICQDTLLKDSIFIASDLMKCESDDILFYDFDDPDEIEQL